MKRGLLMVSIGVVSGGLLACRMPWTVRPIDAQESASGAGRPFEAAAFVAGIWDREVVPAAAGAADFTIVRHSARPVLVKGTGRVLLADAAGQRLLLDMPPYDGKPDTALDSGRIRGTALRDSLPFVQFSQFVNQVDYAHAANALNERASTVAEQTLSGVAPGTLVSFTGALIPAAPDGLPEIVPITISTEPARP